MIRRFTYIAAVMILALLAASCSMEGQFGFRKFGEDTYRRSNDTLEFTTHEAVDWVYVFNKKHGTREIGVVYRKKELVWVEMLARVSRIDTGNKVVYGTIKNFPPGHYQVVLTDLQNDNALIDSKDFIIYEKDSSEEE